MNNLRKWMADTGHTQEALASKIDATQGTVSHWIAGRFKPSTTMLLRLRDVTGLSIEQLLDREAA